MPSAIYYLWPMSFWTFTPAGGKTLNFFPFAAAYIPDDKRNELACFEAMRAFNAPYSVQLLEVDNVGMYDTAVESMGKAFVSTELGGGVHPTVARLPLPLKLNSNSGAEMSYFNKH